MHRTTLIAVALCAVAAAASPAAAQKKPARAAEPGPCVCPEEVKPPVLIREGGLAECTDGVDNDGDGHLDCLDQDCEIYAVCVARPLAVQPPPTPPVSGRTYTNMRDLKRDLHAGAIAGPEFFRWQMTIRAWRDSEIDLVKAEYRAGRISRHQYRASVEAIRLKYEGQ